MDWDKWFHELQEWFKKADSAVQVAIYTGLRANELAALNWGDVSRDFRELEIKENEGRAPLVCS